ncbi:MAG: bifunctional nuclease family protein [Thermodesulfobacteriota bacterium]|nr:bifunctional nuclease family protein [Thermodesulfobacteriota bacterium]
MFKEMKLSKLVMDPFTNTPILILKDLEDKEALSIWIGLLEASAIVVEMEEIKLPRPMTHDLVTSVLNSFAIEVSRVEITDLKDNTYFALIHLVRDGKLFKIDARPSDAIALALRTRSPIYVHETVIEQSKNMDSTIMQSDTESSEQTGWEDILENMSPEDFKYKM